MLRATILPLPLCLLSACALLLDAPLRAQQTSHSNVLPLRDSDIARVDPSLLNMVRAKVQAGSPEGLPFSRSDDARHATIQLGDREVTVAFGRGNDGKVWVIEGERVPEAFGKGEIDRNGWFADLRLHDGLGLRMRWLQKHELLLHRTMALRTADVRVGQCTHAIGLVHIGSGASFRDPERLQLLVDHDGDGRFSEDEKQRCDQPLRIAGRAFRLTAIDDGCVKLAPFEGERGLVRGFVFPDGEARQVGSGDALRLDDLRGQYLVVNVWSPGCVPCVHEIPTLSEIARGLAGTRGLRFVAIAPGEPEPLRAFLKKHPFAYEQLCAAGESELFQNGFPHHFVLAPDGTVLFASFGGGADIGERMLRAIGASLNLVQTVAATDAPPLQQADGIAASASCAFASDEAGRIHRIDRTTGVATVLATIPHEIGDLALRGDVLFASSVGGNQILQIRMDGQVSVLAGTGDAGTTDGPATHATFDRPRGLAVSPDGRWLFVRQDAGGQTRRIALE